MRDARGRFMPGPDKDRHKFTVEQSKAGYEALVLRIMLDKCVGKYWAKRYAFRRMCRTESVRYNAPHIAIERGS